MTTLPDTSRLFDALDATWAAHSTAHCGPFKLRDGRGGGQRVSAASLAGSGFESTDIEKAETAMSKLGQHSLFQLRPEDTDLDATLQARGYEIVDPVVLYAAKSSDLAALKQIPETVISGPIALELMADIWAAGGLSRARVDVMDRVTCPKRYLMLRYDNHGCGAGFVASDGEIAMLHALEVAPKARRQGVGRTATAFAGQWAQEQGAIWLTLATVAQNKAACALYEGMGFEIAGAYHYRRAPQT